MDHEQGHPAPTGSLEPFGGFSFRPFGVLAVLGILYGAVVASVLTTCPTAITVVKYVAPIFAVVGMVGGAWYGFFFNISNHCTGGRILWGIIGGLGAAAVGTLVVSLVMAIVGTVIGFAAGWLIGSLLSGPRRAQAPLLGAGVGAIVQAGWANPVSTVQAGLLGGVIGVVAGPVFLLLCAGLGYVILRKTGPPRHPFD
jgi:hypothetical protein